MRYRFREGMFYFKLPVLVELQLIIDSIYQNSRVDKTLWDSDFKDNKIDKWVYFAGLSLIHMNDAFQLIYVRMRVNTPVPLWVPQFEIRHTSR